MIQKVNHQIRKSLKKHIKLNSTLRTLNDRFRIKASLVIFYFLVVSFLLPKILFAADGWTEKFPDPNPKPTIRENHGMAYIGDDKVLFFGGSSGGSNNDTWVYDLSDNTWTSKSPTTKPPAEWEHVIAFIGGDNAILYGVGTGETTWVYDRSADLWTEDLPDPSPTLTYGHVMSYIGSDQVLLFGGYDPSGADYVYDTWVYGRSANTWTKKSPTSWPTHAYYCAMSYIGDDKVVLFTATDSNETWVYDLSADKWTKMNPSTKPSRRYKSDMAYLGEDRVLLFGGFSSDDGGEQNDTWIYDLSDDTWTQNKNPRKPPIRRGHGFAETSMDGSTLPVLFGGANPTRLNDTWVYGPVNTVIQGTLYLLIGQ